jgi:putative ABC transport system permease protein
MTLVVAWRNIWRNKRRTLITIASVFFALYFALMIRSIQIGTFGKMTDDMISSYTGHIQIHHKGFWDEPIINNVFERDSELEMLLSDYELVDHTVPRIVSGALASVGIQSKNIQLTGIDPIKENAMTHIADYISEGNFLEENDDGAVIGERVASYLGLSVGDTLVMIGQGYHSASAAGLYPIRGILKLPSPELNARIVYISLEQAQEFYGTGDQLSSLSILLKDNKDLDEAKEYIQSTVSDQIYDVMDWGELLVELEQLIQSKQGSSYIMTGLLYMIVGFGIFGTIVMMTAERWREFGLLAAVGMKKAKLMLTVFTETVILGLLGVMAGFAVALPIMIYFNRNPIVLEGKMAETYKEFGFEGILVFSDDPGFMINQIIVVSVLILIAAAYPIFRLRSLRPVEAMRV